MLTPSLFKPLFISNISHQLVLLFTWMNFHAKQKLTDIFEQEECFIVTNIKPFFYKYI